MYFSFRNKILFKSVQNTVLSTLKKRYSGYSVPNTLFGIPPKSVKVYNFANNIFRKLNCSFSNRITYSYFVNQTLEESNIFSQIQLH